jgi:hypothetical protein
MEEKMEFILMIPFGGLPISSPDLGQWYPKAIHNAEIDVINLNYEFWLYIVSVECMNLFVGNKINQKNMSSTNLLRVEAEKSLADLRAYNSYCSVNIYSKCIKNIENYLNFLNSSQTELSFSILLGLRVNQFDYHHAKNVERDFNDAPFLEKILYSYFNRNNINADSLLLKVKTQYELVFTIVLCKVIRNLRRNIKICLVGHEYESFILSNISLNNTSIKNAFDSIVLKPTVHNLHILIEDLKAYRSIPFIIDENTLHEIEAPSGWNQVKHCRKKMVIPKLKSFFPDYSVSTRLSMRPCYWKKCSFCIQNNKVGLLEGKVHENEKYSHIKLMYESGYRYFVFTDEALDKSDIMNFGKWVKEKGLKINWLFRTRLDCGFDQELVEIIATSGCTSVGFGFETINRLTLESMNKYKDIPSLTEIERLFNMLVKSNIMIHLNLILGYPGESIDDMGKTIDYVGNLLNTSHLYTFTLNKFTLFKDTKIYDNPRDYGIEIIESETDFSSVRSFVIKDRAYSDKEFNDFIYKAHNDLWKKQACSFSNTGAKFLYNNTLHGIYLRQKR